MGWPVFLVFAGDTYLVYSLFELAGNDRIFFVDEYLYHYHTPDVTTRNCYRLHESYDARKSSLRTPL